MVNVIFDKDLFDETELRVVPLEASPPEPSQTFQIPTGSCQRHGT